MSKSIRIIDDMEETLAVLRDCGIGPTPQRIAVVGFVLKAASHPSADEVLENVRRNCPTISRVTVYNTLHLLVEKGLLRTPKLRAGTIGFDSNVKRHHHFIDETSGRIYDVPWDALKITGEESLKDFEVREYQIVLRGRKRKGR